MSITAEQLWDPFPDISYLERPEFKDRYQQFKHGDFSFILLWGTASERDGADGAL